MRRREGKTDSCSRIAWETNGINGQRCSQHCKSNLLTIWRHIDRHPSLRIQVQFEKWGRCEEVVQKIGIAIKWKQEEEEAQKGNTIDRVFH